jgi:hypothetical protein
VELNNQAKHSVANNMDKHRVHLIFDYVDEYPIKQRYLLSPGEVVHQTRRSIDLAREMASVESRRKAPTFIIIGAQVCSVVYAMERVVTRRVQRRRLPPAIFACMGTTTIP